MMRRLFLLALSYAPVIMRLPARLLFLLATGCTASAASEPPPNILSTVPGPTILDNCGAAPSAQLRNLTCSEAAALIEKLKQAQTKVENGEQVHFELLSGALASDEMAKVAPRDAFVNMPFDKAFIVERVKTDNRLWQPYKFVYRPAGTGRMIWDVEVALGFGDERLLRVQMLYAEPPPL